MLVSVGDNRMSICMNMLINATNIAFQVFLNYILLLNFVGEIRVFRETVATLFAESGCRLEDTLAVHLREYIMAGEWDHALGIVDKMSPFVTHLNLLRIREKLYEEKFVDLLGKERVMFYLHSMDKKFVFDHFCKEH